MQDKEIKPGRWGQSESTYLKKEDLIDANGNLLTANVTIESLKWELVGKEGDKKPTLFFVGKSKGLTLNKVNQHVLSDLFGDPPGNARGDHESTELTQHFIGKQVQVYVDPSIMFGSDRVGGLRLRAIPAQQAPPQPPKEEEPPPPPPPETIPSAAMSDADVPF